MNTPILQQLELFSNEPKTITIQLTQGQQTIISAIDADLANYKWYAFYYKSYADGGAFAAVRKFKNANNKYNALSMHREILARILGRELLTTEQVDHANNNSLDNRRENLRLATKEQNMMNRSRFKNNTSGYKGVSFRKDNGKYVAYIQVNKHRKHLGLFDTAEMAYKAYCDAGRELYGEFFNPG